MGNKISMEVHVESLKEPLSLPDNWDTLSLLQQKRWFLRNYGVFVREGEPSGIREEAPAAVKEAFDVFRQQPDCPWHTIQ